MEVSLDKPDKAAGLKRRMTVQIPSQRLEDAVDQRLRGMGSNAKIPGFRPGKAPLNVLRQKFGDQARQEVVGDLLRETYPQALEKEGLNPASQPNIEISKMGAGDAFEYVATFDVYPEIKLKGLEKIKIKRPVVEITDADVDRTLETMRKHNREFIDVERAAQDGDQVVIDFVGRMDGEIFAGGSGNDVEVELGSGKFLPDMEKGIVGHDKDETFTVDVAFPKDYRAEDLAGKTANFEITLKAVREPKLPDIDAEFAKKMGVEDGSLDSLRDKVRTSLERERDQAVKDQVKEQVLDGLLKANPIDLPEGLIKQEVERMRHEAAHRIGQQQMSHEELHKLLPDEVFEEGAKKRVALGLLIAEVIKDRELKLDPARVEASMNELAAGYEKPEEVLQYYRSNEQARQGFEAMTMEEQVVESLVDTAKVKDDKTTFEKLVKRDDA